jgi:hypothetical protein
LKSCKRYEYKDHLGNVRVVSNDIKSRAVSTVPFTTKICNFANYYPYGMQQTGTAGSYDLSSDYRYGYNGKEKDDEIKGEANSLDYGARILIVISYQFCSFEEVDDSFTHEKSLSGKINNVILKYRRYKQ